MKIIDNGLNKTYEYFLEDMNNILQPIRDSPTTNYGFGSFDINNKPITSFRKYLKPSFEIKKILINEQEYIEDGIVVKNEADFNLWELYTTSFKEYYNKYFEHLNDSESDKQSHNDESYSTKKFKLRNQVYQDFKLKLCLVEDEKMLTIFLRQLSFFEKQVNDKRKNHEVLEEEKEKDEDLFFWKKFLDDIGDLHPKILLYIIPMNDPSDGNNLNPNLYYTNMLSEYLANKDYIYQTLIFNPWMSHKENFDFSRLKGNHISI